MDASPSRLFPDSLTPRTLPTPRNSRSQKLKFSSHHFATLDDYLSNIGFGLYQIRAYLILGFVLINDGAEVVVLSFLLAILNKEWGLSTAEIGFLGSVIFAGFFVGSLFAGKISDIYGRKKSLIYVVLALYVFAMWSAFVYSYPMLVFVRTIFGFLVGLQFPMCFTYLAEITPKEGRGKFLVLAGGFFTLGELLACLVAFFTLESSSSGNWRALFIWVAQPALLCGLGIAYLMHESPRHEIIVKKNYKEGRRILESMFLANGMGLELNEEDEEKLKHWVENTEHFKTEEVASIRTLFKGKTKYITAYLWPTWMVLSLVYYGMVYILPMSLDAIHDNENHNENEENRTGEIWGMVSAIISEIPSIVLGYFIVEHDMLGRKNSMVYGFIGSGFALLFAGLFSSFVFWVSIARGILNCAFIIASPYTTELYSTKVRTTGLGMASAASRIGGVIMPWIALPLLSVGPTAPYLGFVLFCGIGAFCCYKLPYDTTNKELDFELKDMSNGREGNSEILLH